MRYSFPTYDDLVKVRETMVKMNQQSNFDQFKMLRKLAAKRARGKNVRTRRMMSTQMNVNKIDSKSDSSDEEDGDDKKGTKFQN